MPEFVNPKYADAKDEVQEADAPRVHDARLPQALGPTRVSASHPLSAGSPSRLSRIRSARRSSPRRVRYAASPGAGEAAVYDAMRDCCGSRRRGRRPTSRSPSACHCSCASIALTPNFAPATEQILARVVGPLSVSARSSLVLDGAITLHSLKLDGASIQACAGAHVDVRDCVVIATGLSSRWSLAASPRASASAATRQTNRQGSSSR